MNKKSKKLILFFVFLMVISTGLMYYRYMIARDFEIVDSTIVLEDVTE